MRIAIILYCLLSAIINVSAAENVTPGKYFCVVSDAVGLETNARKGIREAAMSAVDAVDGSSTGAKQNAITVELRRMNGARRIGNRSPQRAAT
jgi:hypothetical protein